MTEVEQLQEQLRIVLKHVEELRAERERLRAIVNEQAAAIVQLDAERARLEGKR
jgi:predicted nuclease with TOPRIM domain